MPILNMIAQGSGGGGGGSNVGEPTNLSALATSNSSIDIKWTDNGLQTIPPSTFGKSVLVRKVGSAPTTPSDGTTVVTETVMNTYQSSAYTDTGLTQGTTYYYQVFSYSTDGGITYGTPVSATPSGGWHPGANTIAYYPLDSTNTVNDLSGNSNTLTNQGATFGTYGGVDCANTTGYSLYGPITNLPTGNSARTISIRCNAQSLSSWMAVFGYGANSIGARCVLYYMTNPGFILSHYTVDLVANMSVNADTWYSIIYTYDGATATLYINGTSVVTESASLSTASSNLVISGWDVGNETWSGYLSNFIMENVAWTAQEVADYYNQTKANYGIS